MLKTKLQKDEIKIGKIKSICAEIIKEVDETTNLKLQKLFFYTCALSYSVYDIKMGDEFFEFQAWIHGPTNRELFYLLSDKTLYDIVNIKDLKIEQEKIVTLSSQEINIIKEVCEVMGKYDGSYLEALTHVEEPWKKTRAGIPPTSFCTKTISYEIIKDYYKIYAKN